MDPDNIGIIYYSEQLLNGANMLRRIMTELYGSILDVPKVFIDAVKC